MPQGFQPSTSNHSPLYRLRQGPRGLLENKTASPHLFHEDTLKALRGCAGEQEGLNVPVLPVDRLSPPSRSQLCPGQSW